MNERAKQQTNQTKRLEGLLEVPESLRLFQSISHRHPLLFCFSPFFPCRSALFFCKRCIFFLTFDFRSIFIWMLLWAKHNILPHSTRHDPYLFVQLFYVWRSWSGALEQSHLRKIYYQLVKCVLEWLDALLRIKSNRNETNWIEHSLLSNVLESFSSIAETLSSSL